MEGSVIMPGGYVRRDGYLWDPWFVWDGEVVHLFHLFQPAPVLAEKHIRASKFGGIGLL